MVRSLSAVAIVVIAAIIAQVVSRRRRLDPPTQPKRELPTQLDRGDFQDADVPWLVVVFTSATCSTCADVIAKAEVLRSRDVSVVSVSFQDAKETHARYAIDAVPCLVIADADGVVRTGFLGPVTATDLWAAVAECRQPGSIERDGHCEH